MHSGCCSLLRLLLIGLEFFLGGGIPKKWFVWEILLHGHGIHGQLKTAMMKIKPRVKHILNKAFIGKFVILSHFLCVHYLEKCDKLICDKS